MTPSTRAISKTALGAISSSGTVNVSVREPGNLKKKNFINNDENHIEVLIVWFETFVEYDDALRSFISEFKQVYKDIIKKSFKSKAKVDMKRIFQQSKSQTNAMVNGSKVLDEAMNAA